MTQAGLQAAIDTYHDLCTPQRLAESWSVLEAGMRSRRLMFGDRLLCVGLRPNLLSLEVWAYLCQVSAVLASALNKAFVALMDRPELRVQLWLTPEEERIIAYDAGYAGTVPIGRLDSFLVQADHLPASLQFVEYNAESPAAIAYEDELAEVFQQTPLLQAFGERFLLRSLWGRPAALQTMLRCYRRWGGQDLPRVAIVDWPGLPTESEFYLFQEYFARHAIRCVIADPHDMVYRSGTLFAAGTPVDFVYKRVLTHELLERFGLQHPLIDAVRDGAVCMMNPFAAKVLHKKASLAFLSDEQNRSLFSDVELAVVQRHVPWTRRVEERWSEYRGSRVDLLPFIVGHRERLVLKPNDAYGGKGIVLGWETSAADWLVAVVDALRQPYVVQEQAPPAYEDFPCMQPNGKVKFERRLVDCDPFLFDGHYVGGCLTRLSAGALLNVTAGGGSLVPTFVVAGPATG